MRILTPTNLAEALRMMSEHPGAGELVPMAGCTDLLVFWPTRVEAHDREYLDLSSINELRSIRWTNDSLELGALTTYWEVIRDQRIAREFPMLIEAARQVGAIQIQTRGTWAGNIANASPAADGVPALMAYDAVVIVRSTQSTREIPLAEFYTGYRKTVRKPDELITAIRLPRRTHSHQSFHKVGPRRVQAITKVGVAIAKSEAGWRIVANSVAPVVKRCVHIERALIGGVRITAPNDLLPFIDRDVSPIDDIRSTAEYRRQVFSRVLYSALQEAAPGLGTT